MQTSPPPDPYAAELGDWRLAAAGWVTAWNGEPLPEPAAFHKVSTYNVNDRTNFSFRTPSSAALHLNAAWKAAARGDAAKRQLRLSQPGIGIGRVQFSINVEDCGALFDYFEEMMTVAISSFAAIEAFRNQTVVERAKGRIRVKRRKTHVDLTAEEVERTVGTGEKLGRIVPDLLGVPSPTGKPVWGAFDRIKSLRDDVTHFKRRDESSTVPAVPTVLHRLYARECYAMPEDAMSVLRYFVPSDNEPRWMRNPAWVRPAVLEPLPPAPST